MHDCKAGLLLNYNQPFVRWFRNKFVIHDQFVSEINFGIYDQIKMVMFIKLLYST